MNTLKLTRLHQGVNAEIALDAEGVEITIACVIPVSSLMDPTTVLQADVLDRAAAALAKRAKFLREHGPVPNSAA